MEGKKRALEIALEQVEKQYGKGTIMQLGQKAASMKIDIIPTGALTLDLA
ncbi:MAG: DNA recombination/repair protein RecA, partial [Candidatus Aureabacteria bacterium]|nr:DNA recombination/repair protein RecA [Candidatus Auribacterota bacterium]